MSNELLYLKQNVQIEPLVDQWYAQAAEEPVEWRLAHYETSP